MSNRSLEWAANKWQMWAAISTWTLATGPAKPASPLASRVFEWAQPMLTTSWTLSPPAEPLAPCSRPPWRCCGAGGSGSGESAWEVVSID